MEVRAGSAAGTTAGRATSGLADFNFLFDPAGGFLELDFQIVAKIRAPCLVRPAAPAAEEVFENTASA